MARLAIARLFGVILWLAPAAELAAAELAAPTGPVALTVAGSLGKTNRPAFEAFEDSFLAYHERHFKRAAAFDLAMLEALGLSRVTLKAPNWPRAVTLEGPRLADLLAAVEARGGDITLLALDGFAVKVTRDELAQTDWIVAIRADGRPLGLGQRGPAWLVYDPADGRAPTDDDEARWPWSVFYIEIR